MAINLSGTIRTLILDGLSFRVSADISVTEIEGRWTNELVPTSGENVVKKTRRAQTREGFSVICDTLEFDLLKDMSERIDAITMSYTLADGSVYTASGTIELENRTTDENKATVKLLPLDDWELFAA